MYVHMKYTLGVLGFGSMFEGLICWVLGTWMDAFGTCSLMKYTLSVLG